jgi:hypothetical protein
LRLAGQAALALPAGAAFAHVEKGKFAVSSLKRVITLALLRAGVVFAKDREAAATTPVTFSNVYPLPPPR